MNPNQVVSELIRALGSTRVLVGADVPARHHADWSGVLPVAPMALVSPQSTEEVAVALRICHSHGQAVAVQGGLTGLAGAAAPLVGEVALSLEHLAGVQEVDQNSATLTAWAGTPLEVVQNAAEAAGFHCGIDLGARGSCTIGGNVATNAGGTQVLRYGMARENVLGLEVVLADGTVLPMLNKMMKNNTGYDIKQLFIGSEGTLGVITRVVLALHPKPREIQCAMVEVKDFDAALDVLRRAGAVLGTSLLSFEAMWPGFRRFAAKTMNMSMPLNGEHGLWLLLDAEARSPHQGESLFEEFLANLYEDRIVTQAVVAQSLQERKRLWSLREAPSEFPRLMPGHIGFDVSIPLGAMTRATQEIESALVNSWPDVTALFYGHVADSNLHLVVHVPSAGHQPKKEILDMVYGIVNEHRGAISAEHGIGMLKKAWLGLSRSESELSLMKTVKISLDARNILNPGRIFDLT